MSARRGRKPGKGIISRDTASFLGGWGLMVYEAIAAVPFNTTVFVGGMVAAGIPGVAQALDLWLSARMVVGPSDSPESVSSGPSSS